MDLYGQRGFVSVLCSLLQISTTHLLEITMQSAEIDIESLTFVVDLLGRGHLADGVLHEVPLTTSEQHKSRKSSSEG